LRIDHERAPHDHDPIVLAQFRLTIKTHGIPASTLTVNGMVFTTRLSGLGIAGRRNGFEAELRRLNTAQKKARPGQPTPQGKVEHFQQTMKNWLRADPPSPPRSKTCRNCASCSHRSRPHHATPVIILANAIDFRVAIAATGERLREPRRRH
jgi:hypothetical protein